MTLEYRAIWKAGSSNPGYSIFHARGSTGSTEGDASQDLADAVREFFNGIRTLVTNDFTWTFPPEVLDFNTSTGVLEEVHTVEPPTAVSGSSATAYAAPAGARVEWRTGAIVSGRRLRGRTFVVPIGVAAYEADGTLTTSAMGTLKTAGDTYLDADFFSGMQPAVWSRTHGIMADITSCYVPDEAAVLRSRRN